MAETIVDIKNKDEAEALADFMDTLGTDEKRVLLATIEGYRLGLAYRQQEAV